VSRIGHWYSGLVFSDMSPAAYEGESPNYARRAGGKSIPTLPIWLQMNGKDADNSNRTAATDFRTRRSRHAGTSWPDTKLRANWQSHANERACHRVATGDYDDFPTAIARERDGLKYRHTDQNLCS